MSKNNGGPAFPTPRYLKGIGPDGMTLRDYFAAKAMQAMIMHDLHSLKGKRVPALAYEMADAMLAARDQ